MTLLPVDDLLVPLSADQPAGIDLSDDPAFAQLERDAEGTPERQTGQTLVEAVPPRWPDIHETALALARRSRDLRLGILLARAGARTTGLAGYASGLRLIEQWLVGMWESVHPQLDASDGNDPTMRINALAALWHPTAGLKELRAAAVASGGYMLTVRLIELCWTKSPAEAGESRPTPQGLTQGLREAASRDPTLPDTLRAVHQSASTIERLLAERLGNAAPDLRGWLQITRALVQAADAIAGVEGTGAGEPDGVDAAPGTSAPGAIRSRDDVVRTLGLACEWIELHEPSHPAPLLIRRAQRLMSKSFIELVRDLAPEGLSQLERVAGVPAEP